MEWLFELKKRWAEEDAVVHDYGTETVRDHDATFEWMSTVGLRMTIGGQVFAYEPCPYGGISIVPRGW